MYAIGGGKLLEGCFDGVFASILNVNRLLVITYAQKICNNKWAYYEYFKKFCNEVVFDDFNNFSSYDCVFILGGETELLYEKLAQLNFANLVLSNPHITYLGISAGAIVFFDAGFGDKNVVNYQSNYYGFAITPGFKLIDGLFCPHYQKEGIEIFNDIVKEKRCDGYALEDGSICLFEGKVSLVCGNAYRLLRENDYILEVIK